MWKEKNRWADLSGLGKVLLFLAGLAVSGLLVFNSVPSNKKLYQECGTQAVARIT